MIEFNSMANPENPKTFIEATNLIDEIKGELDDIKNELALLESIKQAAKEVIEKRRNMANGKNNVFNRNEFWQALENLEHLVTE